jgi:hypothetical protein
MMKSSLIQALSSVSLCLRQQSLMGIVLSKSGINGLYSAIVSKWAVQDVAFILVFWEPLSVRKLIL